MGTRFDAAGEDMRRTASLPAQTAFTLAGFARRVVNSGGFENLCGIEQATASAANYMELIFQDTTLNVWSGNDGNVAFASSPAVGSWFFFAIVSSGTGAGQLVGYWCAIGATSLITASHQNSSTFSPGMVILGSSSYGEQFNGVVRGVRVWDAALTSAELLLESQTLAPVRLVNLHLSSPCIESAIADNAKDFSGNGRNWTHTGTLSLDATPPAISYRGRRNRTIQHVAAGGGGGGTKLLNRLVQEGLFVNVSGRAA